jgi:hypothetical protein
MENRKKTKLNQTRAKSESGRQKIRSGESPPSFPRRRGIQPHHSVDGCHARGFERACSSPPFRPQRGRRQLPGVEALRNPWTSRGPQTSDAAASQNSDDPSFRLPSPLPIPSSYLQWSVIVIRRTVEDPDSLEDIAFETSRSTNSTDKTMSREEPVNIGPCHAHL